MADRDPKKMALEIASLRAFITNLPESDRPFADPYAEHFFDPETQKRFRDPDFAGSERARYEELMPGAGGALVARICFIDELMTACIARGVSQVVSIGAGYDTRPYRLEAAGNNFRFYEIDHPETQAVKIATMERILDSSPQHVVYVPVVFGQDRLDQKLLASSYDPSAKSLFIAEGLLMYIPPPAVDGLLGFIAKASAPGSAFVADVFPTSVIDGTSPLPEAQNLKRFVEQEGSSLMFGVNEPELEGFFAQRGFRDVRAVSAVSCKEKYFRGQSRDMPVSTMFTFVTAEVAAQG
ncbi:MAG: class I SAM-dependent methyltransferase [Desulfovibrio sp.]|nr:MAG: class I SAM-dependent methyltransferase [Desulfovibrio sp.]